MKDPISPDGVNSIAAPAVPLNLRARVHLRASELAKRCGRQPMSVSQSDYEQAKRELTGERDHDRQQFVLDAIRAPGLWAAAAAPIGLTVRALRASSSSAA